MVTIISRTGVSLSAGAGQNGFPPANVAKVYKVQRHEGDFAESDLGRARRQDRRNKRMTREFFARS